MSADEALLVRRADVEACLDAAYVARAHERNRLHDRQAHRDWCASCSHPDGPAWLADAEKALADARQRVEQHDALIRTLCKVLAQ